MGGWYGCVLRGPTSRWPRERQIVTPNHLTEVRELGGWISGGVEEDKKEREPHRKISSYQLTQTPQSSQRLKYQPGAYTSWYTTQVPGTNKAEGCLVSLQWENTSSFLERTEAPRKWDVCCGEHPLRGKGKEEWDKEMWKGRLKGRKV